MHGLRQMENDSSVRSGYEFDCTAKRRFGQLRLHGENPAIFRGTEEGGSLRGSWERNDRPSAGSEKGVAEFCRVGGRLDTFLREGEDFPGAGADGRTHFQLPFRWHGTPPSPAR